MQPKSDMTRSLVAKWATTASVHTVSVVCAFKSLSGQHGGVKRQLNTARTGHDGTRNAISNLQIINKNQDRVSLTNKCTDSHKEEQHSKTTLVVGQAGENYTRLAISSPSTLPCSTGSATTVAVLSEYHTCATFHHVHYIQTPSMQGHRSTKDPTAPGLTKNAALEPSITHMPTAVAG